MEGLKRQRRGKKRLAVMWHAETLADTYATYAAAHTNQATIKA